MGIERTGTPQSIAYLLDAVEKGKLGIPDFQRDFVWSPDDIAELLRTVVRDWPCGTLLLQEGPQEGYACRHIAGSMELKKPPTLIVLDGQQRITALFHAYKEKGDETFFINFQSAVKSGEVEDEHIQFESRRRYFAKFPTLKHEAESGRIRFSTIVSDDQFYAWLGQIKETDRSKYLIFRTEKLPGIKHYSIPGVKLDKDLPLGAVAKIFETINRYGIRLDTFDLMTAKLFPHKFNLRERNSQATSLHPVLEEFESSGIEILRLIALQEHLRQLAIEPKIQLTIKGVRRSDVIDLPPSTVTTKWASAVESMAQAISMLQVECGMLLPDLLPSGSMLLPVAYALSLKPKIPKQRIQRWFWSSCFAQTHAQGANTQAVADARALGSGDLEQFDHFSFILAEQTLEDSRRRNEIFLRGLACALIKNGARDPLTNAAFSGLSKQIVFLPIFPKDYFAKDDDYDCSAVGNQIMVSAASAKVLRTKSVKELLEEGKITEAALNSQLIPVKDILKDNWGRFFNARRSLLLDLIKPLVGA